ncbi:MAG TPA: hypothetical protein VM864_09615 [Pyrinomonadaceae bacterium]|jgi:hypothetical protein|nr:hypothetical protein [Pyrinomonadaceae bacterium]
MKHEVVSGLIAAALLLAPLAGSAAGQNVATAEAVKARAAEAQARAREVVVKLRPGTKILVGEKELTFEFLKSASLGGRIKEMREKDFTLAQPNGRAGEVMAVIGYDDVLSVKHPSGFKKALKNVGRYSLGGVEPPVFLPLYGVMALLGRLPRC